jgi:RNA polymerase sigma-70 factor (ECF subfamily)
VGVEKHYPENSGEDEDRHAGSLERVTASGQLSARDRGADVGAATAIRTDTTATEVNGSAATGTEPLVTAALSNPGLFPAISPKPTHAHTDATWVGDDAELLRRAGTGDAAAFRDVFVRHRSDVARLVYRMLNAPADLEDVVQEVFVQVFRSLKDFRGQSKFSTWLHRVTVNVVLMHRRSAKSRPVLAPEAPQEMVPDERRLRPDEEAEKAERLRAFQRLLGRLAEKKRIVFVLHELEGLSPTEIAEIVGAPVLTVRTRLFYARRELEDMLAEEPSLAALEGTFGPGDKK